MSRSRRQRSKRFPARRAGAPSRDVKGTKRGDTTAKRAKGPSSPRRHVLMFLCIFAILLALFYAFIAFSTFYNKRFVSSHHHWIAQVSGGLLAVLGQDNTVAGASISSPRFSVDIIRGCDAIEPIALYVCAILAFPLPFSKRLFGIIVGAVILVILNFIRIVSLVLIKIFIPILVNKPTAWIIRPVTFQ